MAKRKKEIKILPIEEIIVLSECYPREEHDEETSKKYAEMIKNGVEFPIICVASFNQGYILVDGKHRLRANEINGEECVECEIIYGLDKKQIFIEAVKRNIGHGKPLTREEVKQISITLEDWEVSQEEIKEIVHQEFSEIKRSVAQEVTSIVSSGKNKGLPNTGIEYEEALTRNESVTNLSPIGVKSDTNQLQVSGRVDVENKNTTTIEKFCDYVHGVNLRLSNFVKWLEEYSKIELDSFEGKEVKMALYQINETLKQFKILEDTKEDVEKIKGKLEKSLIKKPKKSEYLSDNERNILNQMRDEQEE